MTINTVIEHKLLSAFSPLHLDVINESYRDDFNVAINSHFKIIIVSREFDGERIRDRHHAINSLLARELEEQIGSLVLHTYTEKEWFDYYEDTTPLSTFCLGARRQIA